MFFFPHASTVNEKSQNKEKILDEFKEQGAALTAKLFKNICLQTHDEYTVSSAPVQA